MKVFILEDDPKRIAWMKLNFDSRLELDITEDVKEAIKWLHEKEYDAVFLDHDLGGEQMVSSTVWNTGSTVAKMIHETPNKVLTVIIHSWNPVGAKGMGKSLTENGVSNFYFPFGGSNFKMAVTKVNELLNKG